MEILQGMVQDPGYQDEPCTYGKVDDNTIYYFIKDYQLANGNIIATTNLKEAIGHAAHTQLGLIDKNGKILIPFENKSIKKLKDNLLLVERNIPVTESVASAFKNKSDPFTVQSISENSANIKKQIKSVMGMNGDFIFDNHFSEAAIYTIDGLNVAGNYFSFIGENNGDYYLATNVLGATILKFNPSQLETPQVNSSMENQPAPENENIQQSTSTAAASTNLPADTPAIPTVQQNIEQPEAAQVGAENATDQGQKIVQSNNEENAQEVKLDITLNDDASEQEESQKEMTNDAPKDNSLQKTQDNDDLETKTSSTNNDSNGLETTDESEIDSDEIKETSIDLNGDDKKENEKKLETDDDSNDGHEEQIEDNTNLDSIDYEGIETAGDIEPENDGRSLKPYSLTDEDIATPTIKDATNMIRKLLEETRKQRIEIDRQNGELETLKSNNDILSENNASQKSEIDSLRNEMMKYRSQTIELTRKNIKLEGTLTRQTDIIKNLETQNTALREQVAGMNALSKAVAEANILVDQESTGAFDSSGIYDQKSEIDDYLGDTKTNEITYGTFNGENSNPIPNIQTPIESDPTYQKKLVA